MCVWMGVCMVWGWGASVSEGCVGVGVSGWCVCMSVCEGVDVGVTRCSYVHTYISMH